MKILTVFAKIALIFSKMVDYTLTKMLKINVNSRISMKTSSYFIDLQLVFHKKLVFCNYSNYAFNSVYEKIIDILNHGQLNSHKNDYNQCKQHNSNENKRIFH